MNTMTILSEAEIKLRALRSATIQELRNVIRLKSRDQILLRQSIKEKARANDQTYGSLMCKRFYNKGEITAALTLYAEIRGKKSSHSMKAWSCENYYNKLIQQFGGENIAELKK